MSNLGAISQKISTSDLKHGKHKVAKVIGELHSVSRLKNF